MFGHLAAIEKKLEELGIEPQLASSVKEQEEGAINYGIIDPLQHKFVPAKNVSYIWSLFVVKINENTTKLKLHIGVEDPHAIGNQNPLGHSHAFEENFRYQLIEEKESLEQEIKAINEHPDLDKQTKEELTKKLIKAKGYPGRGHPSLTFQFNDKGEIVQCAGVIAGEFSYNPEIKKFVVKDRSGRYKDVLKKVQTKDKKEILEFAATHISFFVKADVKAELHEGTLGDLWNKYEKLGTKPHENAIMIIMKAFKRNIQAQIDAGQYRQSAIKDGKRISASEMDEYLAVKRHVYAKNLSNYDELIAYFQSGFIADIEILYSNNGYNFTDTLAINLDKHIRFLQTKNIIIEEKMTNSKLKN